jgi:tartrate-resistant acid phosphatase type 5
MIKIRNFLPGAAMVLALSGNALAAPVSWLYDSRIYANENSVQNLDGSYTYSLQLRNDDVYDIWLASLYTGDYQARNLVSSISPWQTFAYTNPLTAGEDWSLAGNASTWMATFYDDADAPFAGSLGVGQTATLSFTVDGAIAGPIEYGYFVRDDYEWNRFTAVGSAVPEPSSMALMAVGVLALMGWSLRRKLPAGGIARFFRSRGPGRVAPLLATGLACALVVAGCQSASEESASPKGLAYAADIVDGDEPVPPANLRFATIGDFGWDGVPLSDVADLIKSWDPDMILALGDNNYDNGAASTIDANIGKYFHDYILNYHGAYGAGSTEQRFWAVIGNHDYIATNAKPHTDYFDFPGNERYFDFVRGPVHFFAVSSDTHEPDGVTSTSKQADWLRVQLGLSTSPWNIVFLHHPPFSSGEHGNNASLQWPYQAWGADVVIGGHDHTFERIIQNGMVYFVNGLGGRSLYPWNASIATGSVARYNADYGAQLIEATDRSLTFKFYNRAGEEKDTYTMVKGGGAKTKSFQNGTPIKPTLLYTGNDDAKIQKTAASSNFGAAVTVTADLNNRILMKWDVSALPAGTPVMAASVTFNVTDATTQSYSIFQVKRAWTESEVTWTNATAATPWATAGVDNTTSDRANTSLGTVTSSATGVRTFTLNATGVALVQGWVNGTIANNGIIILNATNTNSIDLASSESATVGNRPKLVIAYQ